MDKKLRILYHYRAQEINRIVSKGVPYDKWLNICECSLNNILVKFYDYELSYCSELPCLVVGLSPTSAVIKSCAVDESTIDIAEIKSRWLSYYKNFSITGYGNIAEEDEDKNYLGELYGD